MNAGRSLLDLPAELRELIYGQTFRDIRLTFGQIDVVGDNNEDFESSPRVTRPRANSLALLHTCRQVSGELRHKWMSWVLFNFDSATAMLSTLLPRGEGFVSRIRYLRICNSTLWLQHPDAPQPFGYGLLWCLQLLPGLQLNTLYVLAGPCGEQEHPNGEEHWLMPRTDGREKLYTLIGDQAICGTGWRHLEIHLADSAILDVGIYQPGWCIGWRVGREELARRWSSYEVPVSTYLEILRAPAETPKETSASAMEVYKSRQLVTSIYDSLDLGWERSTLCSDQADKGRSRRMIVRISRNGNVDISHKPPCPEPGYEATLAGIPPFGMSPAALDHLAPSVHICKSLRSWLAGLSWPEIRLRYIDGTQLEYGEMHKHRYDKALDDALTFTFFSEHSGSRTKAVYRAAFHEHRRRYTTVLYDTYDDIFDVDVSWVCRAGSALQLAQTMRVYTPSNGHQGPLWDRKWLDSIGAVGQNLY